MAVMKYIPSAGEEICLTDLEFQPFDYETLSSHNANSPLHILSVKMRGKVVSCSSKEVLLGEIVSTKYDLESTHQANNIGLVNGGWIPLGLPPSDQYIILADRCFVSNLEGRFENGNLKKDSHPNFVDCLTFHTDVQINPLLYALESNTKKLPSEELIRQQLREAVSKISKALPSAKVIAADKWGIKGACGIISDVSHSFQNKQRFLTRVSSMLKSPVARNKVGESWSDILKIASECNISKNSLVVVAVLSTLSLPNNNSPASKVLKFKDGYTGEDAYNALADLQALEILMYSFAMYPNKKTMLCTSDRNLSLFWVGLQANHFQLSGNALKYDIAPIPHLLAEYHQDLWISLHK